MKSFIICRLLFTRMRLAGRVARTAALRNVYKVFVGKLEGKRPLGLGIDGRIILKSILEKSGGGTDRVSLASDSDQLRDFFCPSGSIRGGEFVD
jgi:hypothetical protein